MMQDDPPSALKRIPPLHRSTAVESQLLEAIRIGRFAEGSRLPAERELAETFGVGRVSVRAALQSLSARGIIETMQGRGSFVRTSPATAFRQSFAGWLTVHRTEVVELLEVRGALEELAVRQAASSPQTWGDLDGALRQFAAAANAAPNNVDEIAAADLNFHAAVAKASGSALLWSLLEELQQTLHEARRAIFALGRTPANSLQQHAAIIDAIKAGRSARAGRTMRTHVGATIRFVETWQARDRSLGA